MYLQKIVLTSSATALILSAALTFCTAAPKTASNMKLTSSAFADSAVIPVEYTCDCSNMSPPLHWSGVPQKAKSLALIADDPDAPSGTWVHWVWYNIPPTDTGCKENIPPDFTLENGSCQGITDFKKTGYGGPCPPKGIHRYFFTLYALDIKLPADSAMTKKRLLTKMNSHILEKAVLMGIYHRQ